MAHAFDNRNSIPNNQQNTFHNIKLPLSQTDITNTLLTRSSSPQSNHRPPSYEESVFYKTIPTHQKQQSISNDYSPCQTENHGSDTKPPPPVRIPRLTSITNNNYVRRTNILPQYSSNGIKTHTTYLNSTQVYITQPLLSQDPPPPPPPRYPLQPPAIPPRNSSTINQKNSVIIPDFNSSNSPKTVYRSTDHRNDLEQQIDSIPTDDNRVITNDSITGEYFGECCKCGEMITSLDDPCDIFGQIYHSSCAVCVLCGRSVKNKHFFIKDQLYCEEDFLYTGFHQTLEQCVACNHLITDTILQALGDSYHVECFKCSKCLICLDGMPFIRDKKQNLFCLHDYYMTYGPQCSKCLKIIFPEDGSNETVRIISMGKTFHIECYRCEDCSMQLGDEQNRRCYPLDNKLFCRECCQQRLICFDNF
ncbi:unnamed protein product [Adineta steineri]|uniref:LIM zinc-binding domain-containing protein n=1 Tax=Adineta steineri TaxID=433720 RepID=A0A814Y0L0_9BILA|nr:unnamed protein product [Adineta steineri]